MSVAKDITVALGTIFGAFVAALGLIFVAIVIGTLTGAVCGWVVGLFFDTTILTTLAKLGAHVEGLTMWQLGATLGFIGGFFRSHHTHPSK